MCGLLAASRIPRSLRVDQLAKIFEIPHNGKMALESTGRMGRTPSFTMLSRSGHSSLGILVVMRGRIGEPKFPGYGWKERIPMPG